jgi:hypothetical protein
MVRTIIRPRAKVLFLFRNDQPEPFRFHPVALSQTLKGFLMRTYALAVASAAIFAFPASAFAQAVEIGPRGVEVEGLRPGRSVVRPVNCDELRKACLNKPQPSNISY